MSTTTISILTRTGLSERALGSVASVFKACLVAYLDRRQVRLDMAELQSMSDVEPKDIGVERRSIEPADKRGRRGDPWTHVDII